MKRKAASIATSRAKKRRLLMVIVAVFVVGSSAYFIKWQLSGEPHRSALESLARRDLRQASQWLAIHLQARPNDINAWLLAAQTFRRQGKFREANEHLDVVAKQTAADPGLEREYQLLRLQQGHLRGAEEMFAPCANGSANPQCELILEAIIEGRINNLLAALQSEMSGGQERISKNEFDLALKTVDEWLRRNPQPIDQAQGNVWRGKLYSLARDYPKSQLAFRSALELQPDNEVAREFLGLLLSQESPQEAALHLQNVYERNPTNAKVGFTLALVRRSLGQLDEAEQILSELLKHHPNAASFLIERASVALDKRRTEDAERWLRIAVNHAPQDAQANLMLSHCLTQTGRATEAKQYYDRFVQIAAQSPRSREELSKES